MRRRLVSILASTAVVLLFPIQARGAQPLSGTLKNIKDTGTMVIGYRENSRPFSFLGPDGKPTGYSIDLCQRIATAAHQEVGLPTLEIKYVPVTVESRIQAVANGTVDIECGSTTIAISRQEQVDFTNPTFLDGGGLLVLVGSGINGVGDLGGKRVAVIPGTTTGRTDSCCAGGMHPSAWWRIVPWRASIGPSKSCRSFRNGSGASAGPPAPCWQCT